MEVSKCRDELIEVPVVRPIYTSQRNYGGLGLMDPGLDIETGCFCISDNFRSQN
jgi:hypothetical protein